MSDITFKSHLTDVAENSDVPFLCTEWRAYCAGCGDDYACDPALHIHIFIGDVFNAAACSEACAISWIERHTRKSVEGKG